jgi:3'(2'), 5'-bisphosphate nucleotidase
MDDHELAAWLAERAGRLLTDLRGGELEPVALGYVADQTANAFLLSALKMLRPEDHILSEESPDQLGRLGAERVWIIDPLDGTREYTEGRDDWAVHVALSVGGEPAAGAVAQPGRGRVVSTQPATPPPQRGGVPVMLVSRSRAPEASAALARRLGAELREMGSAGAKAMAVILGEADIYFHAGGQHEWDNCAPVAVALAAGLIACRIDGSPIRYNQADVRVPDLIIARPEIGRRALDLLAGTT